MALPKAFVTRALPGDTLHQLQGTAEVRVWPGELPPSQADPLREVAQCSAIVTLLNLNNVIIAPHIASASEATRRRMADMAVSNTLVALRSSLPPNAVNPEPWGQPALLRPKKAGS